MWLVHKVVEQLCRCISVNKLPILIYHQVLEKPDTFRTCTPTAEQFRAQMNVVSKYFNPISVDEGLKLLKQKKLPANSICVTFDDGYLNNLTVAAPILQELEIPATVYVASAFTNGRNMWNDRLIDLLLDEDKTEYDLSTIEAGKHVIISTMQRHRLIEMVLNKVKYLPVSLRNATVDELYSQHHYQERQPSMMNCKQLRQIQGYGITVAAHTHDHPIMAVLPIEEQRTQLQSNIQCLSEWGIESHEMGFAYPNGKLDQDYTQETAALVKELGLSYAVTTHTGICTPKSDLFQLPRASSWEKRPLRFHLRLLLDMIRT